MIRINSHICLNVINNFERGKLMKKCRRVLCLATIFSLIMSVNAFAHVEKPESAIVGPKKQTISVYETGEAIPTNLSSRLVPLSFGWSLKVEPGWVQGVDTTADSNSFVTGNPDESYPIDYMYIKTVINRKSGSSYDDISDTNTSFLSLYLNDGSYASEFTTAKSTHIFKNEGYNDTVKYITKNIN
ncbi:hypothetical protein [Hungatella hathewayi]|nr:hypothetical protein [Hungatella hathewayi]